MHPIFHELEAQQHTAQREAEADAWRLSRLAPRRPNPLRRFAAVVRGSVHRGGRTPRAAAPVARAASSRPAGCVGCTA